MLSLEGFDVGAGSSDGTDDLGRHKPTVPVAVIHQMLQMAAIAHDREDELGHLQIQKVIFKFQSLDRFLALFHQIGEGEGEVVVEGETELAVFLSSARECERCDFGVERVHAGLMLREMVHDRRGLYRNSGLADEGREAIGDREGSDAGRKAAKLLHAKDQCVKLHVLQRDVSVQRGIGQDTVPLATSSASVKERELAFCCVVLC